jgi:riboflavin synthase
MFTGIVQAKGIVQSLQQRSAGGRLVLEAQDLPRPISNGSSICVNGACLTVIGSDENHVKFDVVQETLSRSTLGTLKVGDCVNLEPSLRLGDPLDGHMVQGHVDAVARARDVQIGSGGHVIWFELDDSILPFIVPKGSVAIDGVSLTVAEVAENTFSVACIPTTLESTTLGKLRTGDQVNIETDIVSRTIISHMRRWIDKGPGSSLTVEMLRENGW